MNSRTLLACTLLGLAAALAGTTASAAPVTYTYRSVTLTYLPGPANPDSTFNMFGTEVTGSATFDDSLVTPDFTGTISNASDPGLFAVTIGTTQMGYRWAMATFTFTQGQITGWGLQSDTFQGGVYNALIFSGSSGPTMGDWISPFTGGLTVGSARSFVPGEWTMVTPVPLPAALPLLAAGLGLFGAMTSRRRPAQLSR